MGLFGKSYFFEEDSWERLEMILLSTFMDYVLQSMGSQRAIYDWAAELNWTEHVCKEKKKFLLILKKDKYLLLNTFGERENTHTHKNYPSEPRMDNVSG